MLYQFLALFIAAHILLWILGVLTERGGFILVAITILFFTMSLPIIVLEYPQTFVANSTAEMTIHAFRDPMLTMIQFPLLFWYIWSYNELIDWGAELENAGF